MLQVDELNEEKVSDVVRKRLTEFFLNLNSPKCFNPYEETNVLVLEEKNFEDICNSMEDNGVNKVRESTVLEFYSKVQYLEKKFSKLKHDAGSKV